jgi:hypothetical protein
MCPAITPLSLTALLTPSLSALTLHPSRRAALKLSLLSPACCRMLFPWLMAPPPAAWIRVAGPWPGDPAGGSGRGKATMVGRGGPLSVSGLRVGPTRRRNSRLEVLGDSRESKAGYSRP